MLPTVFADPPTAVDQKQTPAPDKSTVSGDKSKPIKQPQPQKLLKKLQKRNPKAVTIEQEVIADTFKGNVPPSVAAQAPTKPLATTTPAVPQPEPKKDDKPVNHLFWGQGKFYHSSRNELLKNLITEFCDLQKISVVISPKISEANISVSRDFANMYPVQFWEEIVQIYGLIWFFDGSVLYVYKGDEAETRVLKVSGAKVDRLMSVIDGFHFHSSHLSLKCVKEVGIIFASGPPKFLNIIQELEAKINETIIVDSDFDVKSFPLKHAWAGDVKFGNTTVPGIVTLLKSALNIQGTSGVNDTNPVKEVRPPPLQGALEKTPPVTVTTNTTANTTVDGDQKAQAGKGGKGSVPLGTQGETVTSDMRFNAVIVRALKENLPRYEKLIADLDKPVNVVEIQSAIVDFKDDAGLTIGMNYMSLGAGTNDKLNLKFSPLATGAVPSTANAWSVNNTIKGIVNGYDFNHQLQLLETKGLVHTLSRPTVTTLDNIEASIQNTTTYYTSVSGRAGNDLYPVSAGMTLKVTPHVIVDKDNQEGKMELLLYIEDGSPTPNANTTLPPTTTIIKITTQAMVYQNQSLLVGGYFTETNSDSNNGLPGLSKIPILGSLLFGNHIKANNKRQRFFLITPRIVHLAADKDAKYQEYFKEPDGVDHSVLDHVVKKI